MKQIVQKIVLSTLFLGTLHASKVSINPNLVEDNKKIASKILDILDAYTDSEALKKLKETLENSSFNLNTPLVLDTTALAKASKYGYSEVAKWLVSDKSVKVDTEDSLGFTPLHLAVLSQNLPIVKLLVENRAKINAENMQKKTALHLSANKDTELMRYLLAHGANIKAKTNNNETVLDCVVQRSAQGLHSEYNEKPRKLKNLKCLLDDYDAEIDSKAIELAYTPDIKKYLQVTQDKRNEKISDAKLK